MNKRSLLLSIAAGLVGGMVPLILQPLTAHAESQAPEEIRAQRFTLVDNRGTTFGSFSFDESGRPQIVIRDRSGHEVWKFVGEHVTNQPGVSGRFFSK